MSLLEAGLALVLLIGPLAFGCVEPWSLALLQSGIFLLGFAVCASGKARFLAATAHRTLLPAAAALVGLGALQWLNATAPGAPAALGPASQAPWATANALLLWLTYGVLIWSVPLVLDSRPAFERFAWLLFLLGVVISAIGLAQHAQGNTHIYGIRPARMFSPIFGPYYNRNHAASVLALSLEAGAGLLLKNLLSRGGSRGIGAAADRVAVRMMLGLLLGVVAFGLYQTRSKGAVAAAALAGWVLAALAATRVEDGRRRGLAYAALAVCGTGGALVGWRAFQAFGATEGAFQASFVSRGAIAEGAFLLLQDFPFGVGLGAVREAFGPYQDRAVMGFVAQLHNDWLEILAQCGWLGLLWPLAVGAAIAASVRQWREKARLDWTVAGLLGGALAFIAQGGVDFSFQIPANAVLWLALLAALAGPGTAEDAPELPPSRVSGGTRWAVGSLAVLLSLAAARPAAAAWYARRASQLDLAHRPYYLSRASELDPHPRHLYALARASMSLADRHPAAKVPLLRQALAYSERGRAMRPYSPDFLHLESRILWQLGRRRDAQVALAESRRAYLGWER